jgi:hypothetical protein
MNEKDARPEGIRAWYDRTTSKARKVLVLSTILAITGGIFAFFSLSSAMSSRLQTFNGALVIPIFGLIWIVGFIYIFLIPQREAGFRSQEWIELMVSTMQDSIDNKIAPAVKTWKTVGDQVEKEFPSTLQEIKECISKASVTMDELRAAAKNLTEAVKKNEKVVSDAAPAIESLKRIETRLEQEFKGGLFENIQSAIEGIRGISGVPKVEDDKPDLDWALQSIRASKKKVGGGA